MIFLVTGAGLSLDDQWDLSVDTTSGDLEADSGINELEKDLAFAVARGINNSKFTGGVMSDGQVADLGLYLKRLLRSDPRVISVDSVDVRTSNRNQRVDADIVLTVGSYQDDVDGDGEVETVEFTTEDILSI